jgi:hypothetical protein
VKKVEIPENGDVDTVSQLLIEAGLNATSDWFDQHWGDDYGWYAGIENHRVWVSHPDSRDDRMWFDSVEEADAWVLACWRMK